MSTGAIIVLVIVLVVIAVAAALASTVLRGGTVGGGGPSGPEFRRLASEIGPRRARAEFAARRRRVAGLGLKSLSAEQRAGYERQWTAAQEEFIDSPPQATVTAAGLVTAVAAERGYEVGDPDRLLADLSVRHGRHLDGYRRSMRVTEEAPAAATEDLRRAMLGHRALFQDLIGPSPSADGATGGRVTDALRRVRPAPAGRPGQAVGSSALTAGPGTAGGAGGDRVAVRRQ